MRRAVGYTLAWCGATALAVGVAWLGVRDVLYDAVLDQPPLTPVVSVTAQPTPPPLAPVAASPSPAPSATRLAVRPHPTPAKTKPDGQLRTITLVGGRATVEVRGSDCRVVSAVPNEGYQVRTWETATWIRVAFIRSGHESSAFCLWDRLPPRLETYEA